MWEACKQSVIDEIRGLPGWCSPEKAALMMDLVNEHRLRTCVDVGAFGGSSCLPLAEAVKYRGEGTLYAIDAWRVETAVDGWDRGTVDYRWWSALDFESLYTGFQELLVRRELTERCFVMRMHSRKAATRFAERSIHFIHLDGNHHENAFMADVQAFYPKVRDGGLLLINDANWPCMRRGLVFLLERTRVLSPFSPSAPFLLLARDIAREQRAASLVKA
ncbi:MAG TPA: class I SAM-dependent methyltransferase [Vicinamibacterales bacterium]|nr:class I SAM-dependent methyltransferase [Vicinamibacterales bacterium]